MYTYSNHSQKTGTKSRTLIARSYSGTGQARKQHPAHRALERLLLTRSLQAKLTVSDPADVHEQEADRVADEVMRAPEPRLDTAGSSPVQVERRCPSCPENLERAAVEEEEEKKLQAKLEGEPTEVVSSAVEDRIQGLSGSGRPLSDTTRAFMEPRFGADFSSVRVHTDSGAGELAREVKAHAFTVGSNIVFAEGRYQPESAAGRHLLAHELSHVVQQGAATVAGPDANVGRKTCPECEEER